MIDLDDAAAMRAADPSGMLGLVSGLADHCREGYQLGRAAEGLPSADDLTAVAFCGMGGSAVAGDVVRVLYAERLRLPVTVIRTPELPAWCGPHTLVVASSYSGNTAETLALFEEAVARGCRMIAVTSGGRLAQLAAELEVGTVRVPGTFMPRAAVGYLALGVLGSLESVGLVPSMAADLDETLGELRRILDVNGPAVPASNNPAKTLALRIGGRFPVVWGGEGLAATAAYRWKTQFNENAKVPAFWGALPELDHNEVVGWAEGAGRSFFLVALRHEGEHAEVAARFPLSTEIARSSGMEAEEVRASGASGLSRLLELVLHGDLVSTYHAIARGVDPTPIDAIARLKRALAEA
ncbi:MAG: bifunctional phosphoglucose/phosphomannose isomerase [Actinomycetota bacterium]